MSIMRDTLSNFIGGVSQQTDKLMLPSQSKTLINHLLDRVEGVKRRPCTKHIAKICSPFTTHPFIHTIIDEDEEYEVILDGTTCSIYDLKGNKQTLSVSTTAQSYIKTSSPLTDLYAVTLADYTFILNKTKTVKFTSDTYTNKYPYSAIIFVKQGNYSTDYTITINGTQAANITTSEDTASEIKTTVIASKLASALSSSIGSSFTITRKGSTILITNKSKA